MTSTRWTWVWYAACAIAVMGGLGWSSLQALEFERREAQAKADAAVQESVRLSLWRMESALAPIIAREAARPYFEYRSFYPTERSFTNMMNDYKPGEVVVPSPLLRVPEPPVLLHFELDDADGAIRSPQVPSGAVSQGAETFSTGYELATAQARLQVLTDAMAARRGDVKDKRARSGDGVLDAAPQPPSVASGSAAEAGLAEPRAPGEGQPSGPEYTREMKVAQGLRAEAGEQPKTEGERQETGKPAAAKQEATKQDAGKQEMAKQEAADPRQVSQNVAEYEQRVKSNEAYNRPVQVQSQSRDLKDLVPNAGAEVDAAGAAGTGGGPAAPQVMLGAVPGAPQGDRGALLFGADRVLATSEATPVVQSELEPRWIGEGEDATLVMTREVSVGEKRWVQGFWLDWAGLRTLLLDAAGGLLPGATLVPAGDAALADPASLGRRLAAIPAEFVVPAGEPVRMAAWSPLRTTLVMTWIGALGGVVAIGLVLRTSNELAERRGRFVSAVTHELRTPLTTFCLYSQMLSDGIVKDPEAQQSYFNTLRAESQRLARIVESVLDYARLGRRKPGNGKVVMRVGELVDQCVGALAARCEQAGMELVVDRSGDSDQPVTTDPATVERVLFNLVDNACKYASESSDKRVHVDVRVSVREVEILVRDHGPGIERAERGRIFRPFVRGKKQVDGSVSGLGLGLALAKGLSEQLGGNLELATAEGGAAFSLVLPLGT